MKHWSGQIIATSHDLTPNGGLVREMGPLISGKSRFVKYYNLARLIVGFLRGGVQGENPEDSGREDWGTLGKIRGITTRDP